jgi:nucleoside-diphosphate-sugar epimerase
VFITGANGFIGANLCRGLAARGFRVTGLVREGADLSALDGTDVELVRGDLRRPGVRLPAGTEHMVHAAAPVSDSAGSRQCQEGIYVATQNLVGAVQEQCPRLRRFVFLSTALVLGCGRTGISPTRPGRDLGCVPYVRYKRETERWLLAVHAERGFPVVILRPTDVYGPLDRTSIAPMCRALDGGIPLLVGTGQGRIAYCHVETVVRAVERALVEERAVGRCYTVANVTTLTWRDFFGYLAAGLGRPLRPPVPTAAAFGLTVATELLRWFLPLARPGLTRYRFKRATTDTTYDTSATVRELGCIADEDVAAQLAAAARWYREYHRRAAG